MDKSQSQSGHTGYSVRAQHRTIKTRVQRLKRVFKIDIKTCDQCDGAVKVIACIEDPAVVKRILDHLEHRD